LGDSLFNYLALHGPEKMKTLNYMVL